MGYAKKLAGLCATGTLTLVGLTTYLGATNVSDFLHVLQGGDSLSLFTDTSMVKPLKVLTLGFSSAIGAGLVGYFLGSILDHPKGSPPKRQQKAKQNNANTVSSATDSFATTDQTFLDDLETAGSPANA